MKMEKLVSMTHGISLLGAPMHQGRGQDSGCRMPPDKYLTLGCHAAEVRQRLASLLVLKRLMILPSPLSAQSQMYSTCLRSRLEFWCSCDSYDHASIIDRVRLGMKLISHQGRRRLSARYHNHTCLGLATLPSMSPLFGRASASA